MLHTGPHIPVSYTARDARTLADMFTHRAARSGPIPAMFEKQHNRWVPTTWEEFYESAAAVAKGLVDLGLKRGDRVAILGATRGPWGIYDMGCQLAGMVSLGIYPKQAPNQIKYLIDHSDARVLFVDSVEELDNVLRSVGSCRKLKAIVPWSSALYNQVKSRSKRLVDPATFREAPLGAETIASIQAGIDPDETAIFIYTSGTTGPPKGAMISHRNILTLLSRQHDFLALYEDDLSFNFLPMAHAAERVLGFYGRINTGIACAYASSVQKVLDEVQEVQPTLFGSVPRIFEKAYAKIHSQIEQKPKPVQHLFAWAKKVARQAAPYRVEKRRMPPKLQLEYAVADRLVFTKIRGAFGGRVTSFVTGAAPIAMEILEFFWGVGLNIYEAYGMTESTVLTHINRPGFVSLGSVGQAIPPMQVRIASDKEILVKGPFVFNGYFKNTEATAATVIEGWLHTGDIGEIDNRGYLRITDRKKHLIITAGGKNLAPANIDNAIKNQDPLISQVHPHGDKRPYVSALIAPSPLETLEWGLNHGLITATELRERQAELLVDPTSRSEDLNASVAKVVRAHDFMNRIRRAVERGNQDLAQVERVRRFILLDRDFSQEEGELTPTMKVKRKAIEEKFKHLFDRIYQEDGFAEEVGA
jgi:long-chain acyl-CoA synthetase